MFYCFCTSALWTHCTLLLGHLCNTKKQAIHIFALLFTLYVNLKCSFCNFLSSFLYCVTFLCARFIGELHWFSLDRMQLSLSSFHTPQMKRKLEEALLQQNTMLCWTELYHSVETRRNCPVIQTSQSAKETHFQSEQFYNNPTALCYQRPPLQLESCCFF